MGVEVEDVMMTDVVAAEEDTMIVAVSEATRGSTTGGGAGLTLETEGERGVAVTPEEGEEDEVAASPEAGAKRKGEIVISQDKDSHDIEHISMFLFSL